MRQQLVDEYQGDANRHAGKSLPQHVPKNFEIKIGVAKPCQSIKTPAGNLNQLAAQSQKQGGKGRRSEIVTGQDQSKQLEISQTGGLQLQLSNAGIPAEEGHSRRLDLANSYRGSKGLSEKRIIKNENQQTKAAHPTSRRNAQIQSNRLRSRSDSDFPALIYPPAEQTRM